MIEGFRLRLTQLVIARNEATSTQDIQRNEIHK
jgi:hypothetical protein